MGISKALIASLFISLLVLHLIEADQSATDTGKGAPKIDCGAACTARCGSSSRPNLCKRACGTCCARCNCVPPGTYGNLDDCPCYANMTTRGNKRKCP
ncbi:Gibberellin regulated protein [Dillenia turbinata]|uniref:Gibberellin regulated protein n=1 Tax=Dillenia turbinata TaxID=194707 RepID=A0AAN8ZFG3_9MAGN